MKIIVEICCFALLATVAIETFIGRSPILDRVSIVLALIAATCFCIIKIFGNKSQSSSDNDNENTKE